jgi:hypothetical protein
MERTRMHAIDFSGHELIAVHDRRGSSISTFLVFHDAHGGGALMYRSQDGEAV